MGWEPVIKRKEGEVVERVSGPLFIHCFALGLTHLRSKMDNDVFVADWARAEAGAHRRVLTSQCCLRCRKKSVAQPGLGGSVGWSVVL